MADAAPVCEVCESTEIRSDAGFYFCQDCGTQQQGRRETEHDVGFGQRLGQVLQKKLKKEEAPKENVPRQRRQKRREDAFLGERALPVEDYPRWLEAIGSRLCTASKLVVKLALTMQQQFGAPPECLDRSQQLFYTYLQKAGVAFCPEETAQDPGDAFCLKIKRNKHEIWRLRQKLSNRNGFEKKMFKKRIARKEKQAAAKAALAAKAGKQEQQQQEKEEEETKIEMPNFKTMDDLADAAVEVMERVETSLTVRAVNMASCIYLGIDLLLCIVYLATQVCGCRWILLSDIFRWYREGRFNISHSQILALNFCTSWSYDHLQPGSVAAVRAAERRFYRRARASAIVAYLAVQPSSESHRVLAFLVQFAGIPRTIYTMDFKKVLARLVYNLNLPRTFLQHLFAIYAHLPQVETDYGADRLSHTMPLDPGLCSHLLFACSKSERRAYISAVGYTSFMRRAFLANYSQQPWCGREWPKHRHFVSLPTEVKAAALILFALKLFFGLDGRRELQIRSRQNQRRQQSASTEEESNGGDPAEAFLLHDWLAQLEMRTHCWQGTAAKAVLAKGFSIDQMERSDPNVQTTREFGKVGHAKGNLPLQFYRNAPFPGCIPNTVYSCAEPGLFQNLFPDQFQPPTPKESKKSQPASANNMSKEALFTPLAMQPIVNRAIAEDQARELDKHRVDTFFKQFYLHSHMNLELPSSTDVPGHDGQEPRSSSQSASDSSRSSSVDGNGNNNNSNNGGEQPQRFGQLFPCANAYSRLPMLPQLKCISMVVPEKDARGFVQRDIHMGRMPYHLLSLPITPLLLHRQLKVALFLSEPLISPIFRALLRHLALAVSETDHVLFFAFLMVESMFFDHTSFQRIEHDLRARGRTLFSCAMPGSMGKPNKFKYKLTLEGVAAGRRLTARTHEFHYKFSRSRDHDRLAEGEDELEMDSKELCHQKLKFPSLCEIPVDQQNSGPSTSKKAVPLQAKQRTALEKGKGKKQPNGGESESSSSSSDEGMEREENVGEENGRNNENEPLSNSSSSSSSSGTDFEDNAGPSSQQPKKRRAAVLIALPTPATLALCSFAHW